MKKTKKKKKLNTKLTTQRPTTFMCVEIKKKKKHKHTTNMRSRFNSYEDILRRIRCRCCFFFRTKSLSTVPSASHRSGLMRYTLWIEKWTWASESISNWYHLHLIIDSRFISFLGSSRFSSWPALCRWTKRTTSLWIFRADEDVQRLFLLSLDFHMFGSRH